MLFNARHRKQSELIKLSFNNSTSTDSSKYNLLITAILLEEMCLQNIIVSICKIQQQRRIR